MIFNKLANLVNNSKDGAHNARTNSYLASYSQCLKLKPGKPIRYIISLMRSSKRAP